MLTVKIEGGPGLARRLKKLGLDVDDVIGAALQAGAQVVQRAANSDAPGPHIEVGDVERHGRNVEVKVGPDNEHWYYKFAETGSGGHSITGDVLRFFGSGGPVYRRKVAHPGHAARPFLRSALDENENQARDAVGDEIKKVMPR